MQSGANRNGPLALHPIRVAVGPWDCTVHCLDVVLKVELFVCGGKPDWDVRGSKVFIFYSVYFKLSCVPLVATVFGSSTDNVNELITVTCDDVLGRDNIPDGPCVSPGLN